MSKELQFTSKELRKKYIEFFNKHNHSEVVSASTIPDANDQTVLFTTAGMQQFTPNLMGKPHSQGVRLSSVQKCVRTVDIDEVGDNRHLTFFEMLGNWSLGDYFKKE
ncbi:TPA: alanine--tRNA ligase, partial [Candidatus Peregrinibacteria bacterium]|nr:alanine--tRNA ligase [Candidatus Peregrinibacteria bacterium]